MQILPSNNSMKYGVASSAPGAAEKIIVKIKFDKKKGLKINGKSLFGDLLIFSIFI